MSDSQPTERAYAGERGSWTNDGTRDPKGRSMSAAAKLTAAMALTAILALAMGCDLAELPGNPPEPSPIAPSQEVRRYAECMGRRDPEVGFWAGFSDRYDTNEYITARCHRLVPAATSRKDTGQCLVDHAEWFHREFGFRKHDQNSAIFAEHVCSPDR